ncbi:uncharacterized protein [Lepeophtheirus salmonis]|uniref:uncharacterized protein isoform X1 n=1 Tax=Lepeophtheirus salmonis TaxID=72036 RepID=UPI001AE8D8A1|nr:uncharacterized protein LOC121126291 [Lepeophtheirus salmonis]
MDDQETPSQKDTFEISKIQIIIPECAEPEEAPKKKKKKKKVKKKKLPPPVILTRSLATALRLINHQQVEEKQRIKEIEIRKKALEQKEKMLKECPDRFSRLIL